MTLMRINFSRITVRSRLRTIYMYMHIYGAIDPSAGCHKIDGSGIPPIFPAMKNSVIANGPAVEHMKIVLHGKGGMPTFKMLGDADLASVITYERNAFGNTASVVQPSDVKSAR